MRRNRGEALSRFFEDLSVGDPIALGLVGVLSAIAVGLGLLVLKARRELNREDSIRAKRYGRRS